MCKICKDLDIHYYKEHDEDESPYKKACYCSFCARRGHTTSSCHNAVFEGPRGGPMPKLAEIYDVEYRPALEVVNDKVNIRAVLLSHGISLSGKDSVNRENVIALAKKLDPPMDLYWVHPATGECTLHVDGISGKKKTKNP